MILFRCTKKMQKQLHLSKSALIGPNNPPDSFLGSWYANLFYIDRRKCILFMNDSTLYSVLLFGLRKPDFDNLGRRFVAGLTANLLREGLPPEKVAAIGMACHPVVFGATNSRRVLGYMNEHIFASKYMVPIGHQPLEHELAHLNHQLNETPMRSLTQGYALKAMKDAVAEWRPS